MLLIADSGSTKADWILTDGKNVRKEFSTVGFNPFFHDKEFVIVELSKNAELKKFASDVTEVKFFGAGCSSSDRNKIIASAFEHFFTNAKIWVDHDMLGAAMASCFDKPGLVAILGTGSNIAFYNGKDITETKHGLGYILGDESSGSYYGKKLITSFLYGIMPDDLKKSFYAEYKMEKEIAITQVYQKPNPNVYLASFAKFLSQHKTHPFIQALIHKGITEFFETNIAAYPQYKNHPVHFIGSIAYHFKDVLIAVAAEKNFTVGKILVKPVEELEKYFLQKLP